MLHSPSPGNPNGGAPGPSFWHRFKGNTPRNKEAPLQSQMAVASRPLLTLIFDDMETIRVLPSKFEDLDRLVRDWIKPPEGAEYVLRAPVQYCSWEITRLVSTPYIYLSGQESYEIATQGVTAFRVEILSDGPPPDEEAPPPPPVPVLEMPGTFNLELQPGQTVALDTIVSSDELDMSRMEDGTVVDGMFWGKLDVVHDGDNHRMEFSGTRIVNAEMLSPDLFIDARVVQRFAQATKPPTAKCHLSVLAPSQQYCDIFLQFSTLWKLGFSLPPVENVGPTKVKWFIRVHPGGAIEHFESLMTTTSLYYEAIPEPNMLDPQEFVAPRNSFAMSLPDFIRHLMIVLDTLGMSLHARTNFINNNISSFAAHKYIAYRFMTPQKLASAIDISLTAEDAVFTRLFLMFRGVPEEEMPSFADSGEKEAIQYNWRGAIRWSESSKDPTRFRVLETSILELV